MISPLEALGWNDSFLEPEDRVDFDRARLGRVVGQHRRQWDLLAEEGLLRGSLAGKRWAPGAGQEHLEIQPVVGDWVTYRSDTGSTPIIDRILPRRTELRRGAAGRNGQGQVVVANVDVVAVVCAFAPPDVKSHVMRRSLNPRRIERYLTAIEAGGARPLVVLNKADLAVDPEQARSELEARLHGVRVISTSAKDESATLAIISELLPQQTVGFVGLSGVGKSSLVNRLVRQERQRTQEAREADARGRHTTTHRELFTTPSGILIIDTPGMREFSLGETTASDLAAFSDIARLAERCRFGDCSHGQEPGCEVRRAVEDGSLDQDRFESYRDLFREIQEHERQKREDPRRRRPGRGN